MSPTSQIQGNWVFRKTNTEDCKSSCYRSLRAITFKKDLSFAGYPMPFYYPQLPKWNQILSYLNDYAKHFGIQPGRVRVNSKVVSLSPENGGKIWKVAVKDLKNGKLQEYEFDYVVISTGRT